MSLTFCTKTMRGIPVGKSSRFPAMRDPIKSTIQSRLGEDDGLFVNNGMFSDSLPYTMQDDYDITPEQEMHFQCAVLENKYLRAEFLPELGGRMWGLYDKVNQRELLTDNKKFLPRNLAIRNAWFAGGTEWNCGRRGHDANTCSPRFAAELQDPEFGPVLRIYDYSRDRKVPFQMDFFLPENSKFLFARGRIYNGNEETVPMYWWSNIAAPLTPGCRVVVPCFDTYCNAYDGGSHFITRIPLPDGEGFDGTYPGNFTFVRDHFYNIPADHRKYECLFNTDGSGFAHLSTRRLQGRKLFVWGHSTGGDHWQQKLLSPGLCDYLELQGGLAKTQQECLPMPPKTAWEWLEAYGAIEMEPSKIFGSWTDAVAAVDVQTDAMLPEAELDRILAATKKMAKAPGKLRCQGSGDGALEELRRGEKLAEHLDYGSITENEEEWAQLLKEGTLPDRAPRSFTVDPAWEALLAKAPESWQSCYHRALIEFRRQDWERAMKQGRRAMELDRNAWTLHCVGNILLRTGKADEALKLLAEAALTPDADAYLIKEVMKLFTIYEKHEMALALYGKLSAIDRSRPMVKLNYATALAHTGKIDEAESILLADGGLEMADAREGDVKISQLFLWIQEQKLLREGKEPAGAAKVPMPLSIDYRTR